MKAIITSKSELTLNLTQQFIFDIVDDDQAILTSQVVEAIPSHAEAEIKNKLDAFAAEYQVSQDIEIGTEIV
jgi:hypothetical protein